MPLTESRFRALVSEAELLGGDDYASGYLRGVRRAYHGARFGTAEERERLLALSADDEDPSRAARAQGYRDGLRGIRPKPRCEAEGCQRRAYALGLCPSHYQQRKRGQALRPLRGEHGQIADEPLERVTLGLRPAVAQAVTDDQAGAREALERWAKSR